MAHRRKGHAGKKTPRSASPSPRIYTVLPPPPGYNMRSEESVTLSQRESLNGTEDPAEESNEEPAEEREAEEQKRRRRRRKRKPAALQDSGKDGAALASESMTSQSQVSVDGGGERVSRNKKRKLKKKRHKEKLLSMGLMPRAAALEFTYQKDGVEREEEEEERRRAAELAEFLRTTKEIYMSDTSLHVVRIPQLSATLDDLVDSFASGCKPNSVLKQLYSLKTFIQQKETENLEKALNELSNNPFMSAEETTAVLALCKYWITDILPMQRHETTGPSATHP
ncbi:uncharacterized protein erich1 [Xenentodon cancila]